MLPGKKRKAIRKMAREATARAQGQSAPPSPPPAPSVPLMTEMACICGQLLRIRAAVKDKRCSCPSCGRKFLISFTPDRRSGKQILAPVYLDDSMATGSTFIAEAHGSPPKGKGSGAKPDPDSKEALPASVNAAAPQRKAKGILDDDISPEPPPAMYFVCPCGSKLLARKEMYDQRVRCPDCKARLLVTLVYDPGAKMFDLRPVRLGDAPSGDTWTLGAT